MLKGVVDVVLVRETDDGGDLRKRHGEIDVVKSRKGAIRLRIQTRE